MRNLPDPQTNSSATSEPESRRSASADRSSRAATVRAGSAGSEQSEGAAIYRSTCADCHDGSRPLPFGGIRLTLSTAVAGDTPTNLLNVVLYGVHPADGMSGPIMPGFETILSDAQLQALVSYVRIHVAGRAPWTELAPRVRAARSRSND